jgi:hypothetical protein
MPSMPTLAGKPSDEVPEILASGRTDITTIFVSLSARHPDGRDAEYIEWHALDHEPDQHRLPSLRASFRLVSTGRCRAARVAGSTRFDSVDHVMTYFFTDVERLDAFNALNVAMTEAGRNPYVEGRPTESPLPGMPLIERGAYRLTGMAAAARVKVGADVLPWWPAKGVYLLIEQGEAPAGSLTEVPGVGGAWWGTGLGLGPPYANADQSGLQITYCFLDGDPVDTAGRLRPVLERRWAQEPVAPLLAAPFHTVVRHDWGRYLP